MVRASGLGEEGHGNRVDSKLTGDTMVIAENMISVGHFVIN